MADPTATPMPDPAMSPAAGAADPGADDSGGGQSVLLTVLDNGDGSYTLIEGDENDAGAAAAAGPEAGAGAEPQGQSFDSPGALLKGILDLLKAHEASASGEGTADDNFDAGYAGGSGASSGLKPAAPMAGPAA